MQNILLFFSHTVQTKGIAENPIVPEVVKKPISLKILSGILLLTVGIYVSIQIFDENTVSMIVYPLSVTLSFGVGVVAIFVSKHYWDSLIFGRSYLA